MAEEDDPRALDAWERHGEPARPTPQELALDEAILSDERER